MSIIPDDAVFFQDLCGAGLGKIVKLVDGRKRIVHGAVFRVSSKSGQPTTVWRPLQKLLPLEVRYADAAVKAPEDAEPDVQPPIPRRATAISGEQRRRRLDQNYLDGD